MVDRTARRAYLALVMNQGRASMDEDIFNMSLRKFLKKVGITAQREIESAVRGAGADGRLAGDGPVAARAVTTPEGFAAEIVSSGAIETV